MFRKRMLLATGLVIFLGVFAFGAYRVSLNAAPAEDTELAISHNVYFALKDPTAANKAKLIEALKKYLSKPEGSLSFAVGTRGEEFTGSVNDKDYDVGLFLVFKNKESFDKYAKSEPHQKFIQENLSEMKAARVFDTRIAH
jgi:Stress responsive A/B Barrel Domain